MKVKYIVFAKDDNVLEDIVIECATMSEMNKYANACKKKGYKVYTEIFSYDTRKDVCTEKKPCEKCHANLENGCKLGFSTFLHWLLEERKMFKCLDCKSEFENPECGAINHWEVDTRREEKSCVCPVCGGSDWEEMKICPSCGNHWIISSEDFCKTCITVATLYVNQIQIDNGADWEQTINLIDYVIEHGGH